MSKPKVAILTSLCDYSPAYSLVGIILDQARMLHRNEYEYDLICLKNFNPKDREKLDEEGLNVRYILPQTHLHRYDPNERPLETTEEKGKKELGFEDQALVHFNGNESGMGYKEALKDYDIIITHDLLFLDWHLVQNKAVRLCIEEYPEKRWIHWVHSGPSLRPREDEQNAGGGSMCYPSTLRFSAAPNSIYAFLNHGKRQDYANMINSDCSIVHVVTNPKDIRHVYGFQEDTQTFIDAYDLMDHQILQVYPFSTPRFAAKGVKKLLAVFSNFKRQGVNAKLVLVNSHCNRDVNRSQIDEMEKLIRASGLQIDKDVIMSSRFSDAMCKIDEDDKEARERWKSWRYSVPARVVQELMFLSNMFIFPSETECCSLIQAEASISGCFMVLNRDFAPMLEFCDPGVLTYEFNKNSPDANPVYYECVAREIWAHFQQDRTVRNTTLARTQMYNMDYIFKTQLEPLLYIGYPPAISGIRSRVTKSRDAKKITPERVAAAGISEEEEAKAKIIPMPEKKHPKKKVRSKEKDTKRETAAPPIQIENEIIEYDVEKWKDPKDGQACPIYGKCMQKIREGCYRTAGHCLMLDQVYSNEELENV